MRTLKMTRRTFLTASGATALAAVGPRFALGVEPKHGGVLRVAERTDPVGFDTLGKSRAPVYTQLALGYTHSRLFVFTAEGELVPDLAASYTQPNLTTYAVSLKKGVRFHQKPPVNGRELVADDVVFTFGRLEQSPEKRLFPTLRSVTAKDRYTVQFELSAPSADFLSNLAVTTMYIYAKEAGKPTPDGGRDYTAVETCIGSGPFMLEEYREKQRLIFKRNPNYFVAGRPYLDSVEVYSIPDLSAQLAAVRTGQIDLIPASMGQGLPHHLMKEARAIPGALVVANNMFQTSDHIVGRVDMKPWSDVRVRRAASLAMDRRGYQAALYPEGADFLSGPIPSQSRYNIPFDKLGDLARWYKNDVAAAKQLLAEAGYPKGFKTKLFTTTGYGQEFVTRTELMKAMLATVGIDADIVVQEYPVWISSTYGKANYEGLVHAGPWQLAEEQEWLDACLPGNSRNHLHIDDPKLTELIRAAGRTTDEASRTRLIQQFVRSFHENMYRVYLPLPYQMEVMSSRVKGYKLPVRGANYPLVIATTWLA